MSAHESEDESDMEEREVARATKLAHARQNAIASAMLRGSRGGGGGETLEAKNDEIRKLKETLAKKDEELREARFEQRQLEGRLAKFDDFEKSVELKSKVASQSLRQSLTSLEKSAEDRGRLAKAECDRLLRLVSGLEKHTMHGHHLVASRTTVGLLLKTRHGLDNLKRLLEESIPGSSSANHELSNKDEEGLSRSEALDGALLDMCRHLEEENVRLESALATARVEADEMHREASVSKLIPHYRMAIVRSRAHAAMLAEQLQREQTISRTLRDQLESTYMTFRSAVETGNLPVAEEKDDARDQNVAHKHASSSAFMSTTHASMPHSSDAQARAVQQDLLALDAEIAELQKRLTQVVTSK